nr:Chain I, GLY-THR-GLY-ALA-THR-PRO-ALA-ASP-ASP [Haloarcula marismortui]
GTGATPADD